MPTYLVNVQRVNIYTATVEVVADDEVEATEGALRRTEEWDTNDFFEADSSDDNVTTVEEIPEDDHDADEVDRQIDERRMGQDW
jgi:hypothetical protein